MSTIAVIHTVFGFASIGFGLCVVLGPKGTRRHRQLGHGYFISMLILCTSAFPIVTSDSFSIFHVLSFNGLTLTLVGYSAVFFRSRIKNWYYWHYHGMYWSFTGLMGATANEIIVHVPAIDAWVRSYGSWGPVLVVQFAILAVAGYLIFRYQNPTLREMGFI